eukprot:377044-Amphidinium_carterae.1
MTRKYELKIWSRSASLLVQIPQCKFDIADFQSSLAKWENLIKRHDGSVARGEELQGNLKVAAPLAETPKGKPSGTLQDLLVNASRLKTYPDMSSEIQKILSRQKHIGGNDPVPMDLGALGKSRCRHCGKTGHSENDCWWDRENEKAATAKVPVRTKVKKDWRSKQHADGRTMSSLLSITALDVSTITSRVRNSIGVDSGAATSV